MPETAVAFTVTLKLLAMLDPQVRMAFEVPLAERLTFVTPNEHESPRTAGTLRVTAPAKFDLLVSVIVVLPIEPASTEEGITLPPAIEKSPTFTLTAIECDTPPGVPTAVIVTV